MLGVSTETVGTAEAQEFRKLGFATNMSDIRSGSPYRE
jgi:N12 class adenine-specific DNA methylase